jgi:hypothetical protein
MSNELKAECSACKHVWAVATLPLSARQLVKLTKNCTCPKCGAGKPYLAGFGPK